MIYENRPSCQCGNLVEKSHTLVDGSPVWSDNCRTCRGRYRYGVVKDKTCSRCNFVPEVSAQLQIDHVDGNNQNNKPENLVTLCCNCHALKSYKAGNTRFVGEENPFFGRQHSPETLSKIRTARAEQGRKKL